MDSRTDVTPFVIDPAGRDIFGEAERIRALGPVARVEMPGGVPAWAVSDQGLLRRLLVDPRVSKDAYQPAPSPHAASPRCGRASRRSPATC